MGKCFLCHTPHAWLAKSIRPRLHDSRTWYPRNSRVVIPASFLGVTCAQKFPARALPMRWTWNTSSLTFQLPNSHVSHPPSCMSSPMMLGSESSSPLARDVDRLRLGTRVGDIRIQLELDPFRATLTASIGESKQRTKPNIDRDITSSLVRQEGIAGRMPILSRSTGLWFSSCFIMDTDVEPTFTTTVSLGRGLLWNHLYEHVMIYRRRSADEQRHVNYLQRRNKKSMRGFTRLRKSWSPQWLRQLTWELLSPRARSETVWS